MTAVIVLRFACAVVAVLILVDIAERMMPLRSVERDRWEWDLRPRGQFPGIDRSGWLQILGFGIIGAGVGAAVRILAGLARPRYLTKVLSNGTTRTMMAASPMIFDSENSANIYAATWLRGRSVRSRPLRGPVLPSLMVRRVLRRGYIPRLFLVAALLAVAVVPLTGMWGRVTLILLWAVLASAVWRATRLGVPGEGIWRATVLGAVALAGAAVQWLPGAPADPLWTVLGTVLAVVHCAWARGRHRVNDDFSIVDTGIGIALPPGMLPYWCAGWLAVIPASVAAVAAAGFGAG
ncbi:MAG: hypothetical protein ACTH1D_10720 [Mycobacteriaceae bacterium]|uniref:hypothetical protein n=1 Tax=Corynebacterium sp. TaxID=1720 RepID=UPI003F960ADF